MKAKCSPLVVVLLYLFVSSAYALDIKIGMVNAAKILDKAPQAESAGGRLEKEFAPREKGLADAQQSLRRLEDELARKSTSLDDGERRRLERELVAQRREIKRSQDEYREDYNIRRNEELGKLQREIVEAIVNLAKSEEFDLIIDGGAVIYSSDQVDITEKVLKLLTSEAQ